MRILKLSGLFILFIVLAGCKDYSQLKSQVSKLIQKEMNHAQVTGLSIAVVDDQEIVWADGFGYADKAGDIPATSETIYRAGSISKLFNATAVMQLADQDLFDIDEPIQNYLSDFSINSRFANSEPITARNMMTHHSGLPEGGGTTFGDNYQHLEDILDVLKDDYVAHPPNTVMAYSNMAPTILGLAMERFVGVEYALYLDENLFNPLEMVHSGFSTTIDTSLLASKAYDNGNEVAAIPLSAVPAGGLNTTVVDLAHFMQMVFNNGVYDNKQIINTDTLDEMLSPQNTDIELDFDFRIGLAWILSDLGIKNAGKVAWHGGDTVYHHSMLITLPEHKLGVVVLTNSTGGSKIASKIAIQTLKLALQAKEGIKQPVIERAERRIPVTLPETELNKYAGRYAMSTPFGLPLLMDITKDTRHLTIDMVGQKVDLVPYSDGFLYSNMLLFGFIPVDLEILTMGIMKTSSAFKRESAAGHDILITSSDGQEMLFAEKIKEVAIPDAFMEYLGEYEPYNAEYENLLGNTDIDFSEENGLLIFSAPLSSVLPGAADTVVKTAVKPVSDTQAVFYGLGRSTGETVELLEVEGRKMIRFWETVYVKR